VNHGQFQHLLEQVRSEYGDVLGSQTDKYKYSVKSLFWGKQVHIFMREVGKTVPQPCDEKWVMVVAFYVDRTTYPNSIRNFKENVNYYVTSFLV
jgi:hypothetical protein